MFDGNLLNRRSHFHLLFDRALLSKRPVEACPADSHQFTHARFDGAKGIALSFARV
jgi:hypothetical protein